MLIERCGGTNQQIIFSFVLFGGNICTVSHIVYPLTPDASQQVPESRQIHFFDNDVNMIDMEYDTCRL